MPQFNFRRWMQSLPLQLGFGMLLCANYSCSSSRGMAGGDPFEKSRDAVIAASEPGTEGHHSMLAAAGQPLPKAEAAAQKDQYAALAASMPKPDPAGPDGTAHVAKEWPALPEQRVGLSPPSAQKDYGRLAQLPAGGYERPLSEGDVWPTTVSKQQQQELAARQIPAAPQNQSLKPESTLAEISKSPNPWALEQQPRSEPQAAAETTVAAQATNPSATQAETLATPIPESNDPFLEAMLASADTSKVEVTKIESKKVESPWVDSTAVDPSASMIQQTAYMAPATQEPSTPADNLEGKVSLKAAAADKPAETDPFAGQGTNEFQAQTVSMQSAAVGTRRDTEFTPTEPRRRVAGAPDDISTVSQTTGRPNACPPFPGQMPPGMPAACPPCNPAFYPDEYLCDGGDRGLPIHYSPGTRHGLETQDTVAEYQDEAGTQHVQKSNQACVYAPRFGAVKTVSGISENLGVDRALGAYEAVNGLAMNTRMKPNMEQQTEQVNAARVRSRVSGLETEAITLGVDHTTKPSLHSKLENTNTDYGFVGQVGLERAQTPVSMEGIQAAAMWTRKQSPVILASDVGGAQMHGWFRPEEMVGLEEKYQAPGKLYIDKSADKGDAQPGDVITFTIRYRNTGDKSLFNVLLLDNLTPRLEFIEGSATSDRDGRLIVEDNQEGSLILKWEISEEIKGRTGGQVTFKTRVR